MLQCEAITDVDVTAAEMLEQLDGELNEAGVHLAFVELRERLQQLLLDYGLLDGARSAATSTRRSTRRSTTIRRERPPDGLTLIYDPIVESSTTHGAHLDHDEQRMRPRGPGWCC